MPLTLKPHPDTPTQSIAGISVEWTATDGDDVLLTFRIAGADSVVVPPPAPPARTDELWRTTCAELFWRGDGAAGYREFNLSPSGEWAAYDFDAYRTGMRDAPQAVPPHVDVRRNGNDVILTADVDLSGLPPGGASVGLSMVITHHDGARSYWALAHPPGAPDFHHPDCFAMKVPATD
ncbi:DOMON-like domain-containing protein [Sphingomonas sp. RS2018]